MRAQLMLLALACSPVSAAAQDRPHVPLTIAGPEVSAGDLWTRCQGAKIVPEWKGYCEGFIQGAWLMAEIIRQRSWARALGREKCYRIELVPDRAKVRADVLRSLRQTSEAEHGPYSAEGVVYGIFLGRYPCTFYPNVWRGSKVRE